MAATATVDDVSNASAPVGEENGGAAAASAAAQSDNASNADAQSEILQEAMDAQEKAMKDMQAEVKRPTYLVLVLTMNMNESKDEKKADDKDNDHRGSFEGDDKRIKSLKTAHSKTRYGSQRV